jgi:hypothetical protein
MNILITTLSLLLVLAISSNLFWKEALSSSYALNASKGFFEASRLAQNKAEQKRFSRWKELNSSSTPSLNTKKPKPSSSRKRIYVSHRNKTPPIEQGRLHIAPLWEKERRPLFQPVLERLFTNLYGHAPWFDKKKLPLLIEAIARVEEPFDETQLIEKLDKEIYALWHRMLRGTQVYDTEKKIGYPPLKDYLDFSPISSKHACHFPFAPVPILEAIFGPEITKSILKIEKSKWEENYRRRYCLKKELMPFLRIDKQSAQLVDFVETFLYFGQSIGRRSFERGEDQKSRISHRCKIRDDVKEGKL